MHCTPWHALASDAGSVRLPSHNSTPCDFSQVVSAPLRTSARTGRLRLRSCSTMWLPNRPVPPVTRFMKVQSPAALKTAHRTIAERDRQGSRTYAARGIYVATATNSQVRHTLRLRVSQPARSFRGTHPPTTWQRHRIAEI